MPSLAESLVSSAARKLPVRRRPDLSARLHRYQGRAYWVVKDPVGLRYYRLKDNEHFLLQFLDGKHTLELLSATPFSGGVVALSYTPTVGRGG